MTVLQSIAVLQSIIYISIMTVLWFNDFQKGVAAGKANSHACFLVPRPPKKL